MKAIHSKKINYTLLLFLLVIFNGLGQNIHLSEKAQVSVLTCGLGNESYSLFGHTAIRVSDPINNLDVVYNYGAFDFATPNFVAKFAKGDLQYFAVANLYIDFINQYEYEKRSVYEQELRIPLALKQKLYDNLTATLLSDDRFYTYKFIDKNCTSMVVAIINKTIGSSIITKKADTDKSYRTILFPYFDGHFYEKLGTSIIFGTKVDQLGTHLFLPFELLESIKTSRFQKQPLSTAVIPLLSFEKEDSKSWWNNWYTYLVFLLLILLVKKRSLQYSYLTIMGLLGLFFCFMGFYSLHHELEYNYNMLLFNPSLLLLVYFKLRKDKNKIKYLIYFNWACILFYVAILINKSHVFIVLPIVLTNSFLLFRLYKVNGEK